MDDICYVIVNDDGKFLQMTEHTEQVITKIIELEQSAGARPKGLYAAPPPSVLCTSDQTECEHCEQHNQLSQLIELTDGNESVNTLLTLFSVYNGGPLRPELFGEYYSIDVFLKSDLCVVAHRNGEYLMLKN